MGLEKSWNSDVGLATLNPAPWTPELYEELWWDSAGGNVITDTATSSGGTSFLSKGSKSTVSYSTSSANLYTHSVIWQPIIKCAFEASIYNNTTGNTAYAALWDITSNSIVGLSQVSNASAYNPIVRSGTFTLIPGHSYGVTLWGSGATSVLVDASLIIFPSVLLASSNISNISLINPSGNTLKESYIPLWISSSTYYSLNFLSSPGTLVPKGWSDGSAQTNTLHILSTKWLSNQKFAFEISTSMPNGDIMYAALWDITSNSLISGSQVTNSSTNGTFVVIRSGSFTLIQGHSYGVTIWSNNGNSDSLKVSKAYLVALAP